MNPHSQHPKKEVYHTYCTLNFENSTHYWISQFHHRLNHNKSKSECQTGTWLSASKWKLIPVTRTMAEEKRYKHQTGRRVDYAFNELIMFQKWSSWIAKKQTKVSFLPTSSLSKKKCSLRNSSDFFF